MAEPVEEIARWFIDAINAHDADAIADLLTDDHLFVDAMDRVTQSREAMRAGWRSYFGWFPDYRIEAAEVISRGDTAAIFGHASGTFAGGERGRPGASWRIPAAWKAVVRSGLVAEWRVYTDIEPMLRSMGADRAR